MPTADIRNAIARFNHANYPIRRHAFASGFAFAGLILPVLRVAEGTLWIAIYYEDGGRVGAVQLSDGLERFVNREYVWELAAIPVPQLYRISHLYVYTARALRSSCKSFSMPGQLREQTLEFRLRSFLLTQ
jgi:hypothetical protein